MALGARGVVDWIVKKGVWFATLHRHERQYSLSSVLLGYTIYESKASSSNRPKVADAIGFIIKIL